MLHGTGSLDICRMLTQQFPTSVDQPGLLDVLWASLDVIPFTRKGDIVRGTHADTGSTLQMTLSIPYMYVTEDGPRYLSIWMTYAVYTRLYTGRSSSLLIGLTYMFLQEQRPVILENAVRYLIGFEWCFPALVYMGRVNIDAVSQYILMTDAVGVDLSAAVVDGICSYPDLCDLACQWICSMYVLTREAGLRHYNVDGPDSVLIQRRRVSLTRTYQLSLRPHSKSIRMVSKFQLLLGNMTNLCTAVGDMVSYHNGYPNTIVPPHEIAMIMHGIEFLPDSTSVLSVMESNMIKYHIHEH